MKTISRAQLLRGNWDGKHQVNKPPWALPVAGFAAACDGCGDCVDACTQNILVLPASELPQVDFRLGECTFCGDCAAVCTTGALARNPQDAAQPWQARVELSNNCLGLNQIACERCVECCEAGAIVAEPVLMGLPRIAINSQKCNGCGACVANCPADTISVQVSSARSRPKPILLRNTQ